MAVNYAMASRYYGQWVKCHSVWGWHSGMVSHVSPYGITISNMARLASVSKDDEKAVFSTGQWEPNKHKIQVEPVQFFGGFGFGGFFPFGGIFGLYPFGFGGGFFW